MITGMRSWPGVLVVRIRGDASKSLELLTLGRFPPLADATESGGLAIDAFGQGGSDVRPPGTDETRVDWQGGRRQAIVASIKGRNVMRIILTATCAIIGLGALAHAQQRNEEPTSNDA
jgi:hypothetical protein